MGDAELNNVENEDSTEDEAAHEEETDQEDQKGAINPLTFWLSLAVVLVVALAGGIALGTYVVPIGTLPNDPNLAAANAISARLALEQEVSGGIEEASTQTDETELAMQNPRLAVVYTVHAVDLESCADFVGFQSEGELRTVRMTNIYPC